MSGPPTELSSVNQIPSAKGEGVSDVILADVPAAGMEVVIWAALIVGFLKGLLEGLNKHR